MAPRPHVITCRGGSSRSRLAAEVARELETRGAAGPILDLARAGDGPIVAIDGCASACASRQAAVRGVTLVAAVNLAELGVAEGDAGRADRGELAHRVVSRLGCTPVPSPSPPRPRRQNRTGRPRAGSAHDVDDYLLAMDATTSPVVECGALVADAPTLASHVSDELGVSRASAGEMLRKLETEGLVGRGNGKQLLLTAGGRARADAVVRRQRLLEVLATDVLGYEPAECREPARALRSAFDDEAIARLERRLGVPERCPHGCPVDPARAREEARQLRALPSLGCGERATVAWLRESDTATLRALAANGIRPDTAIRVVGGSADALELEAGGRLVVLDAHDTAAVLVRPSPPE